jgi:hypothetical protein
MFWGGSKLGVGSTSVILGCSDFVYNVSLVYCVDEVAIGFGR